MSFRPLIFRTTVAAVLFFLAGCASTPPPRYYTLGATAPASTGSSSAPASTASTLSVSVGPVSVPAVVDRPQIVVSLSENQVSLDESNLWAAPLQDGLSAVLAENLAGILGTPAVTVFPRQPGANANYRVAVDLQRFESKPGVSAVMEATWIVRRAKDGTARTGRTSVGEAVQDRSFEALAAAHSRAAARLSADIADAIRALDLT
jgi:uncharacterized lipoprotein YmbA